MGLEKALVAVLGGEEAARQARMRDAAGAAAQVCIPAMRKERTVKERTGKERTGKERTVRKTSSSYC